MKSLNQKKNDFLSKKIFNSEFTLKVSGMLKKLLFFVQKFLFFVQKFFFFIIYRFYPQAKQKKKIFSLHLTILTIYYIPSVKLRILLKYFFYEFWKNFKIVH